MPVVVTRGSSTGEHPPCQAPQRSEVNIQAPYIKAKTESLRMSLFQGENPTPNSLVGPAQK